MDKEDIDTLDALLLHFFRKNKIDSAFIVAEKVVINKKVFKVTQVTFNNLEDELHEIPKKYKYFEELDDDYCLQYSNLKIFNKIFKKLYNIDIEFDSYFDIMRFSHNDTYFRIKETNYNLNRKDYIDIQLLEIRDEKFVSREVEWHSKNHK